MVSAVDSLSMELSLSGIDRFSASVEKAKSEITVILDGHKYEIPYDSNESILDVAYQNGLDLPFRISWYCASSLVVDSSGISLAAKPYSLGWSSRRSNP